MLKAAIFSSQPDRVDRVYGQGGRERIASITDLYPETITQENLPLHLERLRDLDVIFSTWGMFVPSEEQFAVMKKLKAVFYGAGSVQAFARPFLQRGIHVYSAWQANGVPVMEFTVSQILLATKGYFASVRAGHSAESFRAFSHDPYRGNYGATVAVLGAGVIGKGVLKMLRAYRLKLLLVDPFVSAGDAAELGAEKVTMEEAFARADVVTNHIANLPATVGMLKGEYFASMKPYATFINTGRGATVRENEMIEVMANRPDLTFLLDVT
ncbi:MAG: phosphoglycerate dehydrogenase [Clostridia bacterium]|nr:phosphoglycerate dehydrogenase [Clostridia bacterium]